MYTNIVLFEAFENNLPSFVIIDKPISNSIGEKFSEELREMCQLCKTEGFRKPIIFLKTSTIVVQYFYRKTHIKIV